LDLPFAPMRIQSGRALHKTIDVCRTVGTRPQSPLILLGTRQTYRQYTSLTSALTCPESTPFRRKWHVQEPIPQPSKLKHLAFSAWIRHAHTRSKRRRVGSALRNKSTASKGPSKQPLPNGSAPKAELSPHPRSDKISAKKAVPAGGSPILDRLPHLPNIHRPTRDELLAAATSAWSRFMIHFKWFSIKSTRKFNVDDISAFFSWILLGHIVWFIIGTTTFFSLIILTVNTVFAQGMSGIPQPER
jgi:hypothetical protein